MNDNPHRARVVYRFLEEQNIERMETWPAYSPDMNPIQAIWDQLGKAVNGCIRPGDTLQGLRRSCRYLTEEWRSHLKESTGSFHPVRSRLGYVVFFLCNCKTTFYFQVHYCLFCLRYHQDTSEIQRQAVPWCIIQILVKTSISAVTGNGFLVTSETSLFRSIIKPVRLSLYNMLSGYRGLRQ